MRSLRRVLIGIGLGLAACTARITPVSPMNATPTLGPVAQPTSTHIPVDLSPAQRAAIANVAQSLGLPAAQVELVSTEAVIWPDGCMGIRRIGVMCAMNQVPGFRIVLSVGDKEYEVHTNQDGSIVVPAQAMQTPGPAQQAAIKQLATNVGVPDSNVRLVDSTLVEWPDSCLGVAQEGVMCAQMVTPGYLIVLEAGGRQYEYHTNQDASMIVPASLAMNWSQQGGVAGFCETLNVYLSGEVYGMDCRVGGDGRMAVLTAAQRAQLYAWIDKFGMTSIDLSDSKGAADAMTRKASLLGTGRAQASEADVHAIYDFGQTLYHSLYP